MKFSAYIPVGNITPGEFQSMQAITEMAQALEKAEFDACCVTDHPAPSSEWLRANGHDALDPFTALAFVAAASSTLLLQTAILVLPYRNPFITAKAAGTLQLLSGGRLILGIGAGYQKAEFDALGVDFHRRGILCDDALEAIQEIWRGGVISREGPNYHAVENEPRPAIELPPKIWIGGSSKKAVKRAVEADGWCPFFSVARLSQSNRESGIHSVADLRRYMDEIEARRAEQGITGSFDVSIAPQLRVKDTADEARQFIDELNAMKEAGVTWATIYLPHPSRAAYLENIQWFKQDICPAITP